MEKLSFGQIIEVQKFISCNSTDVFENFQQTQMLVNSFCICFCYAGLHALSLHREKFEKKRA